MTPVDQTRFHSETTKGNCTEAAVASLLGLNLGDVPDFHAVPGLEAFWEAFETFIESQGFVTFMVNQRLVIDCYHLASGPSERGVKHMVVMRNGEVAHDPHPSRAGLLSVEICWLVIPKSPADVNAARS